MKNETSGSYRVATTFGVICLTLYGNHAISPGHKQDYMRYRFILTELFVIFDTRIVYIANMYKSLVSPDAMVAAEHMSLGWMTAYCGLVFDRGSWFK